MGSLGARWMEGRSLEALQERQYLVERLAVRRIEQLRGRGARLTEHRLLVRERQEAALAVIGADSRGADAAERQPLVREMPQRIVDGDPACERFAQHALAAQRAASQVVERERVRTRVEPRDRFVE